MLPGGLRPAGGVLGGPWGPQGRCLSDFGAHLGAFGAQKSAKNGSKIKPKTNCAFDPHLYRSGGFFGAILRPFWGAFFDSGRGKREFLKTLIFADSIALFDVFLHPRGLKIT